eukprot:6590772-Pyramimonas_sp.AAC.1
MAQISSLFALSAIEQGNDPEGARCIVEHGVAERRRARQSVVWHRMALRCVVKSCITKHCSAKRGIAQRHRREHGIAWR